jgi:glycosyltransferase involved in cell wall biosynthesis
MTKRALVVHPGTQHSFQLAAQLEKHSALSGFHTCFAIGADGVLDRMLRGPLSSLLSPFSRRRLRGVPACRTHLYVKEEVLYQIRARIFGSSQALFQQRNKHVQEAVPDSALREADVVVGFDTSSWLLSQRCKHLGRPFVLVQSTVHPDAKEDIDRQIVEAFPEWSLTLERRDPSVRASEEVEYDNASVIVVASTFAKQTLIDHGVDATKIRTIPLGVDSTKFAPRPRVQNKPFRFIYVGAVSTRKGMPILIDAWRELGNLGAELWLVGAVHEDLRSSLENLPRLRLFGHVNSCRVPEIMPECDVMVFPSFFDGFGLVILQAMACGLPVIASSASAGPDLIEAPGSGGWIVLSGDAQALTAAMADCLKLGGHLSRIGAKARSIAEQHSWDHYGAQWLRVIEEAAALPRVA